MRFVHPSTWIALGVALALWGPPARADFPNYIELNSPSLPGEYLTVANKSGLEFLPRMTIEAWVRPEGFDFPTVVGNDYMTSFWFGLSPTGKLRFWPGTLGSAYESNSAVAADVWTHAAVTYDGTAGRIRFYINGALDREITGLAPGTTGSSSGDLRIGADREGSIADYFWRGALDEIRIWDVERTAPEIAGSFQLAGLNWDNIDGGAYTHLRGDWGFAFNIGFPTMPYGLRGRIADPVNATFEDLLAVDRPAPLYFQEARDYSGGHASFACPPLSNGLTVAAWVFPSGTGSFRTIAGRNYETGFWLGLTPDNRVRFYPKDVAQFFDGTVALPVNKWSHVAGVYRSGSARIVVNGVLDVTTSAITGTITDNGRNVFLGEDNNDIGPPDYPFSGLIGPVAVADGPLDVAQIRRKYLFDANGRAISDEDGNPVSDKRMSSIPSGADDAFAITSGVGTTYVPCAAPTGIWPSPAVLLQAGNSFYSVASEDMAPASLMIVDQIHVPLTTEVTDVNCFVHLTHVPMDPTDGLDGLQIFLIDPNSNQVTLYDNGPVPGRDVLTVFDDEAPGTIADMQRPGYRVPIQPRESLSAFDGTSPFGDWTLIVQASDAPRFSSLGGWGLRINGVNVASVEPEEAGGVTLVVVGRHPVRGAARLAFTLPGAAQVEIGLFDLHGRSVRTLVRGDRPAGRHEVDFDATVLDPGVYFAKLNLDGRAVRSLRMVIIR
jgi:Concanavalin A-like lectin/glucanases superfamily